MDNNGKFEGIFFESRTGTVLAVLSGLSFFLLCMLLSLVGPSGSRVPHASENKTAFTMVLTLTLILAGLAAWSKMGRRKVDAGPLPWFSFGLCAVCVLSFFVLLVNGFAI